MLPTHPTPEQMQQLRDMLDLAVNQRNNAQNAELQLGAELVATKRRLAEVEKERDDLKGEKKEGESAAAPAKNGHDNHAAAAA